ncbi:hypothetical protein [Pseudopedobacter beijingensis]|uniref:Uncharacterized protein n=1 Tax=Pseudopedobacter beijingensis TaxID=1207056 RepID=A0ABW4IG73_9SPHI
MQQHNFDVDIQLPSSNQKIKINKDTIEVNQSKINCSEVKAIKYGVSLIGPVKKPVRKEYKIDILDKNDKTLSISFSSSKVQEMLEEDHTYYYVMSGLWQYVKKGLISSFIDTLNNHESFNIGHTNINHDGVTLSYKTWWFGKIKTEVTPWSDLKYYLDKGNLNIQSLSNGKKKAQLSLHNDWNAVVLNTLMHYLWQDNRKQKLAKGEKI